MPRMAPHGVAVDLLHGSDPAPFMPSPQSTRNRAIALAVLTGSSYEHVGRQHGLGRVTPGNWPKVFTALLQDYSASAAKVAFLAWRGILAAPKTRRPGRSGGSCGVSVQADL